MIKKILVAAFSFFLITPAMVQATLMTSASGSGTTTVLSTVSGTWTSAPSVNAGGFDIFAPAGSEVWYGDSSYGLVENGNWSDFAWVGGYCWSGGNCTATIDLGGLYSSVGGFMNYALSSGLPDQGTGGNPLIEALASDGVTVLESYDLFSDAPISTPDGLNDGAFRGISRSSADIAYFRFSGSYLLMHDLTLESTAVPEPSSLALLGLGLVGFGIARKKKSGSNIKK